MSKDRCPRAPEQEEALRPGEQGDHLFSTGVPCPTHRSDPEAPSALPTHTPPNLHSSNWATRKGGSQREASAGAQQNPKQNVKQHSLQNRSMPSIQSLPWYRQWKQSCLGPPSRESFSCSVGNSCEQPGLRSIGLTQHLLLWWILEWKTQNG